MAGWLVEEVWTRFKRIKRIYKFPFVLSLLDLGVLKIRFEFLSDNFLFHFTPHHMAALGPRGTCLWRSESQDPELKTQSRKLNHEIQDPKIGIEERRTHNPWRFWLHIPRSYVLDPVEYFMRGVAAIFCWRELCPASPRYPCKKSGVRSWGRQREQHQQTFRYRRSKLSIMNARGAE